MVSLENKSFITYNRIMERVQIIDDILVELTCPCCPEQYNFYVQDVFHNDCWVRVGYLRARGGCWSLSAPGTWGEELMYGELPNILDGNLPDGERKEILENCVKKVWDWLRTHPIDRDKSWHAQYAEIEDKDFKNAMALFKGGDSGKADK